MGDGEDRGGSGPPPAEDDPIVTPASDPTAPAGAAAAGVRDADGAGGGGAGVWWAVVACLAVAVVGVVGLLLLLRDDEDDGEAANQRTAATTSSLATDVAAGEALDDLTGDGPLTDTPSGATGGDPSAGGPGGDPSGGGTGGGASNGRVEGIVEPVIELFTAPATVSCDPAPGTVELFWRVVGVDVVFLTWSGGSSPDAQVPPALENPTPIVFTPPMTTFRLQAHDGSKFVAEATRATRCFDVAAPSPGPGEVAP